MHRMARNPARRETKAAPAPARVRRMKVRSATVLGARLPAAMVARRGRGIIIIGKGNSA